MKNNYKNEKGIVLPIVVIVFSIMLILGFSIINTTDNETKINKRDEESKKALQFAEAGYNAYLWHLNDDVNFYSIDADKLDEDTRKLVNGEDIKFRDGFYKVNAEKPSDTDRYVKITSTGWTKSDPSNKRTVVAKIRKKQFVHQVYVDNGFSLAYWTTGEQIHGPYHTNGVLAIQGRPIFYDTVSYTKKLEKGYEYSPIFKIEKNNPRQVEKLQFPINNKDLKEWAEKDNMVFQGRTCIYLFVENGRGKVRIKNGDSGNEQTFDIEDCIKNGVIYIEGSNSDGLQSKFDFDAGNVFISGTLKGRLTVAAENIYITYDNPTKWEEPSQYYLDGYGFSESGGIVYYGTKFSNEMSIWDSEKEIYTRYAMSNGKKGANGKDMLGLVANYNVFILHYGWPAPKSQVAWLGKNVYEGKSFWGEDIWRFHYYDMAPNNITIHAAIFAVNGGLGFEESNRGNSKNSITLWGNITQNKIMATESYRTGYKIKCAHDPRMFYDYPPHILEPTNVGWEVIEWKEININEEVQD